MIKIVKVILLTISFSIVVPIASADTDPFPGVANGATIPGTELYGSPGQSQVDFEASPQRQSHTCPSGSGRGGGVDLAFTSDRSKHRFFTNCVKTWQSSAAIDAEVKYRADLAAAQAAALAQSLAWNTANPGQQKCFQWGPITSPSGGTSSGGVCANPVGSAPSSSGSTGSTPALETRTATTTPTTSGGTTSSTSETRTASTTPTTSTNNSDTKTAIVAIPPSSGVAEVVIVPGQGDCPGGNENWRRGIEVNATTGKVVTKCVRTETIEMATSPTTTTILTRVVGSDPYPNITTGAEIPGTRTWSTNETSWPNFYNNTIRANWSCPAIFGPNGDSYAGESNGYDSATQKWFRVCVKNPWLEATPVVKSTPPTTETKTVASTATTTDTQTIVTAKFDPIPGVSNGVEIPGLRITSLYGLTQAQWEATSTYKSFVCPTGSGKAVGVDMNFTTTRSDDTWFAYCVKTWTQPANQNPTVTDTKTVSTTVPSQTTDTRTATTGAAGATSTTLQQSNGVLLIPMSSTVLQTQQTLTPLEKENQLVTNKTSKNQSQVSVNTEFANSLLQLTATKKGAKTITLPVQTNSKGDAKLNVKTSLSGYTVSLKAGSETLDSDKVK